MKIPNVTIQQLLEAGVHLGHKTLRWNPKMKKYIFGKRDSIHIMDLTQTLELTKVALEKIYTTIANNEFCRDPTPPSHQRPNSSERLPRTRVMPTALTSYLGCEKEWPLSP